MDRESVGMACMLGLHTNSNFTTTRIRTAVGARIFMLGEEAYAWRGLDFLSVV